MALVVLGFKLSLANAAIITLTVVELYLGGVLLLKLDLRYSLLVASGLLLAFTGFLWYLSLLAHPPSCGCMGLTHLFASNRQNALAGIVRNVIILWLLWWAYDDYGKGSEGRKPPVGQTSEATATP